MGRLPTAVALDILDILDRTALLSALANVVPGSHFSAVHSRDLEYATLAPSICQVGCLLCAFERQSLLCFVICHLSLLSDPTRFGRETQHFWTSL